MLSKMRSKKGKGGFTLIELMIVVAIIGILAAIAIPNYISFKRKAILGAAVANLETARSALSQYMADADDSRYPRGDDISDYDDLRSVLGEFGLTFPPKISGVKWVADAFSYISEDGDDYTLKITAADGSTLFEAHPSGVCCESGNCNDAKNVVKCPTS